MSIRATAKTISAFGGILPASNSCVPRGSNKVVATVCIARVTIVIESFVSHTGDQDEFIVEFLDDLRSKDVRDLSGHSRIQQLTLYPSKIGS